MLGHVPHGRKPSHECPTRLGRETCKGPVLGVFGVGHLVTHNLIKVNGASKALRVTKVISAAADCLSPDLGHLFQISSQVVSDFTAEVCLFFV